jgi:hypothetical protein
MFTTRVGVSIVASLYACSAQAIPDCRSQTQAYLELLNTQTSGVPVDDPNNVVSALGDCLDQQTSSSAPNRPELLEPADSYLQCLMNGGAGCDSQGVAPGEFMAVFPPEILERLGEKYVKPQT